MKYASALLTSLLALNVIAMETNDKVALPIYVYHEYDSRENHGTPSGWMGDYRDIRVYPNCIDNPYAGETCIKITYSAEGSRYAGMVGVMWQNPANNGGDLDGGMDLSHARAVRFWARGGRGGELIDAFTFGGTLGAYPDTDKTALTQVVLNREWTSYEIDLTDCDASYISSFFGWIAGQFSNPDGFTMYLDEITIEPKATP